MEDGVTGPDVTEEGVAETLTLGGSLHQAGDVGHVQKGRNLAANKNIGKSIKMSLNHSTHKN